MPTTPAVAGAARSPVRTRSGVTGRTAAVRVPEVGRRPAGARVHRAHPVRCRAWGCRGSERNPGRLRWNGPTSWCGTARIAPFGDGAPAQPRGRTCSPTRAWRGTWSRDRVVGGSGDDGRCTRPPPGRRRGRSRTSPWRPGRGSPARGPRCGPPGSSSPGSGPRPPSASRGNAQGPTRPAIAPRRSAGLGRPLSDKVVLATRPDGRSYGVSPCRQGRPPRHRDPRAMGLRLTTAGSHR